MSNGHPTANKYVIQQKILYQEISRIVQITENKIIIFIVDDKVLDYKANFLLLII